MKKIDTRLLMAAAQVARQWLTEDKEWVRNDFAKFAKPYWKEWGGDELVNHMMSKYVNNDEQSIIEYLHNLDTDNKKLVAKYLLSWVAGRPENGWTVWLEDE